MHSSVRTLAAGGLGALIVAVAAMSAHAGPAAAAPTASDPATHTISVNGTGKVTVVPDVARVNLGVTMNQPTVKAARASAAQSMRDIIAAIKALGVADADIQTTGLSLYPQYANGSTTRIAGYTISEQVQVTIRDLEGRNRCQRDLLRAGRPGQDDERCPCGCDHGRPGQRAGNGQRRQRQPR